MGIEVNQEGSEAEKDLEEEAKSRSEDISTRAYIRVHTSKKYSL